MENNKGTKVMALAALIVGVIGITVGFAAYTSTLTINSTATVTPADEFNGKVDFTDPSGGTQTLTCTGENVGSATGTATISGTNVQLDAKLTNPGDKLICKGKVKNSSKYTAYLTTIKADSSSKSGEPSDSEADQDLIDAALADIKLTVQIGDDILNDGETLKNGTGSIEPGSEADLTLTVEYVSSQPPKLVDGAFKVTFPVVTAEYGTVRGAGA